MSYGNYGPPSGPPPGSGYGYRGGPSGGPGGYGGGHSGGHGAPGGFQAGPPPGADPEAWTWFTQVDIDKSGHITATELQQALVNGDWTPFDLDTIKLLMAMFDTDRSGTIGFNEFAGLLKYIKDWQNVFRHFDANHSGTISGQELHNALATFGFNLSPQLLGLLERKYVLSAPDKSGTQPTSAPAHGGYGFRPPQEAGITFDRFVRCCVVVRQLTESFQRLDTQRSGWIQINYETFMHTVLSSP